MNITLSNRFDIQVEFREPLDLYSNQTMTHLAQQLKGEVCSFEVGGSQDLFRIVVSCTEDHYDHNVIRQIILDKFPTNPIKKITINNILSSTATESPMINLTLATNVLQACGSVPGYRTAYQILAHLTSEVGELAQEVAIVEGDSYKDAGEDGIIGESIDIIICCLDMIRSQNPKITEKQLVEIATTKINKWYNSVTLHLANNPG